LSAAGAGRDAVFCFMDAETMDKNRFFFGIIARETAGKYGRFTK
jgi:hypothetical protein